MNCSKCDKEFDEYDLIVDNNLCVRCFDWSQLEPWPEEIEAISKGNTKMELVSAEEFIKELKELEDAD